MDGRKRLTYEEFRKMSREEQNVRYRDLSDHDKFRARLTDVALSGPEVYCNSCTHYRGYGKCDAYPENIPNAVMDEVEKDIRYQCAEGYCYEKGIPYSKRTGGSQG